MGVQLIDAEEMILLFSEIKSAGKEHNGRQTLSDRVMANVEMEKSDQQPLNHKCSLERREDCAILCLVIRCPGKPASKK